MNTQKAKQYIMLYLPYVIIGLLCTHLGEAWRQSEGTDFGKRLISFFTLLGTVFDSPVPSFHPVDLLTGAACGSALRLAVILRGKNAKKFRHNIEYGSARWGTNADIEPFMDPKFENNVILTQTERLTMNSRPKDPGTARNKNVLIVGGSGSGKTRFMLKPNLLQCTSKQFPVSFVVTDPNS